MTKFVLVALLLVCALGSVLAIQISPKLDFDSDEQSSVSSSNSSSYSNPLAIGEGNYDNSSQRDSRGIKVRFTVKGTLGSPPFGGLPRKNPRNAPRLPRGVKNVYVDVSDAGITISGPGRIDCKENFCHMLLTDVDSMGNVIGAVHLTIVAKLPRVKVDDIPVINGVRGTGYDSSPTFGFNNARGSTRSRHFVYKIPQASSVHRQTMRWYRPKPAPATFTPNYGGWNPMIGDTSPVDDKIGAPLSKTNHEVEGPI